MWSFVGRRRRCDTVVDQRLTFVALTMASMVLRQQAVGHPSRAGRLVCRDGSASRADQVRRTRRAHGLSGETPGAYQVSPHGTACAPRRFALPRARTTRARRDALPTSPRTTPTHDRGRVHRRGRGGSGPRSGSRGTPGLSPGSSPRGAQRQARGHRRRRADRQPDRDRARRCIPRRRRVAPARTRRCHPRRARNGSPMDLRRTGRDPRAYHHPPATGPANSPGSSRGCARSAPTSRVRRVLRPRPSQYGSTPARSRRPPPCGGRSARRSWTTSRTWRRGSDCPFWSLIGTPTRAG